jgi:hypothetical protein
MPAPDEGGGRLLRHEDRMASSPVTDFGKEALKRRLDKLHSPAMAGGVTELRSIERQARSGSASRALTSLSLRNPIRDLSDDVR